MYLIWFAVQRIMEIGQYLEGDVWSIRGVFKRWVIPELVHLQVMMTWQRDRRKWKE